MNFWFIIFYSKIQIHNFSFHQNSNLGRKWQKCIIWQVFIKILILGKNLEFFVGVVGLVARPTGGIIDFASGTFDSVKRVTETQEEVVRKRSPRFLHSDGVVRNYNKRHADGCKYLRELEKGKYADSDSYVTHELIQSDRPSVLLVSNRRILFMSYQSVLGNWTTDWEYEYKDITGPPTIGKTEVKLFQQLWKKIVKMSFHLDDFFSQIFKFNRFFFFF